MRRGGGLAAEEKRPARLMQQADVAGGPLPPAHTHRHPRCTHASISVCKHVAVTRPPGPIPPAQAILQPLRPSPRRPPPPHTHTPRCRRASHPPAPAPPRSFPLAPPLPPATHGSAPAGVGWCGAGLVTPLRVERRACRREAVGPALTQQPLALAEARALQGAVLLAWAEGWGAWHGGRCIGHRAFVCMGCRLCHSGA